jgi:hypothetical protein
MTGKNATDTDKASRRGGLPEDDSLSAFAAAANAATTPRRRRRESEDRPAEPQAPEQPATAPAPPSEPAVSETPGGEATGLGPGVAVERQRVSDQPLVRQAAPAPVPPQSSAPIRRHQVEVPDLGQVGAHPVQCTVNVSVSVRDRFAAYQLAKKVETGREPTNAVVVKRAMLAARKGARFPVLLEAVRHRQQPVEVEDDDPEGLFGDVVGRRAERGRIKDVVQQSFRPSRQELAVIDAFSSAYGFPSRSDFLDVVLDDFLPPLPDKPRSRRG